MPPETLFPEALQATVHYSGRVQGVGFRYTTRQTAMGFDVAGWAQNLPDGRVRLVAEGKKAEVDAFLQAVADAMSGYIRKVEREDQYVVPTLKGFAIR